MSEDEVTGVGREESETGAEKPFISDALLNLLA